MIQIMGREQFRRAAVRAREERMMVRPVAECEYSVANQSKGTAYRVRSRGGASVRVAAGHPTGFKPPICGQGRRPDSPRPPLCSSAPPVRVTRTAAGRARRGLYHPALTKWTGGRASAALQSRTHPA